MTRIILTHFREVVLPVLLEALAITAFLAMLLVWNAIATGSA